MNIMVVDTETTNNFKLLSVGAVVVDVQDNKYNPISTFYGVVTDNLFKGGKYLNKLFIKGVESDIKGSAAAVTKKLKNFFLDNNCERIFAYNAAFDKKQLPILKDYSWYDIMKVAAYRQYNPTLPVDAEYCSTGRLKKGYGVENIYHYNGFKEYQETHNALLDAKDEAMILAMFEQPISYWDITKI